MIDFNEAFNDSYERIQNDSDRFFDTFYRNFVAKSDEIRQRFSRVDVHHQEKMMKASLYHLVSFYATKKAGDHLIELSGHHIHRVGTTAEMYTLWLESLLESVRQFDPHFDETTELAWRVTLSPGIEFMKHFSRDASTPDGDPLGDPYP